MNLRGVEFKEGGFRFVLLCFATLVRTEKRKRRKKRRKGKDKKTNNL